jgi:hypothetical protein
MTMPLPPVFCRPLIALLLAMAIAPTAGAEEALGRLFFTPERRQALDRQRQLNIQDSKPVNEDPTLTINGMVTRSSGKRTSWVNGAAQNESELSGGTVVIPSRKDHGKVEVQGGDLPAANARVGETVNRNTGESRDLLNDGRIAIKRPSIK